MRRHPELALLELHGGGGQYDERALLHPETLERCVSINIPGSIHIFEVGGGHGTLPWRDALDDLHSCLHVIEGRCGLSAPRHMRSTSPRMLTLRVITELLARRSLARAPLAVVNGFLDTSGTDSCVREEFFAQYPAIPRELRQARESDLLGIAAYRFWFVRACAPGTELPGAWSEANDIVAFETSAALAWRPSSREPFSLTDTYAREGRDLARLIARLDLWLTEPSD